jgi:8-oxo-dGTP pyrophosphatase MutT (NUDIX family)
MDLSVACVPRPEQGSPPAAATGSLRRLVERPAVQHLPPDPARPPHGEGPQPKPPPTSPTEQDARPLAPGARYSEESTSAAAHPQALEAATYKQQISAGGVLYRVRGDRFEICLIAKHHGRVWALPKGRLAEGEAARDAAIREIAEETGHLGEPERSLRSVYYQFYFKEEHTHYKKTVHYFLLRCVTENVRERDHEAFEVAWFEAHEACRHLHYPNERRVLTQALRFLDSKPATQLS